MMTPMRHHPVPGAAVRKPGFGFETIMANADFSHVRRWYDANSFFAPNRKAAEVAFEDFAFKAAA
jgi:hypothetical protein